jgi:hypothetical protein
MHRGTNARELAHVGTSVLSRMVLALKGVKMKAWVFLCNDSPLEHWMEGYVERFDAWEEGGAACSTCAIACTTSPRAGALPRRR